MTRIQRECSVGINSLEYAARYRRDVKIENIDVLNYALISKFKQNVKVLILKFFLLHLLRI